MKYRIFSAYWLIDELKAGKTVYGLDRELRVVFSVNDIAVDKLIAVLNSANEDRDRYEFWTEDTEENENA